MCGKQEKLWMKLVCVVVRMVSEVLDECGGLRGVRRTGTSYGTEVL